MVSILELSGRRGLRWMGAGTALLVCGLSVACNTSPQAKEAAYLRKGAALLQKKDYARALLEFKNAARAMPKDAEPLYQSGMAYLAWGNFPNAIAYFRMATDLNPQHQQAQLKLAELMSTSGDKDVLRQAATRLESVLSAAPENSEANDALALTEWKLGKTTEATNRLANTLRKFPAHLQSSVALARLKISQKDLAGAEPVLQQAVASAPQSAAAHLALGQFYLIANDPVKAEASLRKAIQLDPKNGSALMGLAAIQVAGQHLDEAEQTYRQLSALPNPQFKPLHALFLYKTGKRDAALQELEKQAKENPSDRGARDRLVSAYQAMGKAPAAQAVLETALKKNAKDTEALYQRAGVFMKAGKIDEAERDLKEVLRVKPDFAEAHVVLANVYRAQHLPKIERQELNEALRINPGLLQARLILARSFTQANEPRSALDLLNNTPPRQKGLAAVVAERNWALLAAGEVKEARSVMDQIPAANRPPELVVQDAVLRLQQGDYSGARADAEEIIRKNPADLRGPRLLADSYAAEKQPAKAEERLKALAAAQPQSAPLAQLLGQWYLNNKNLAEARKAFERATAADPGFEPALLSLAQIDYREKKLETARQRLLAVVAKTPKDVPALLFLGSLAGETGDQQEAIARYRSVLAIDNSNVMALNNLAYTLALSDPEEALKYAQQAMEIAPDSAAVQDTIGWVYYRKAIYPTAASHLEAAVAKDPTPRRQFHLAMAYLKSGKQDLGQKTLTLALRQDPTLQQTEKGW